jgi:hypothetical protein
VNCRAVKKKMITSSAVSIPSRWASFWVLVAVTALADSAGAATTITTCNQNYTGTVDLVLDPAGTATEITYDHDDPPCVVVKNGINFDMHGYKIRCVPGAGHTSCQNPAIQCEGTSVANSNVQDTMDGTNDNDSNHLNIEGPAAIGVKECGTVQKLKMDGPLVGISVSGTNGKVYQKNVIWPAELGTAMDLVLLDNTDRVTDNRIDGGKYGIKIVGKSSTSGPQVDHNIIRGFRISGIFNADSTYFRLEDNTVVEGGPSSVPFQVETPHATYSDNICEVAGPCDCRLDYLTPEAGANPTSNCF